MKSVRSTQRHCGTCVLFRNDPAYLESAIPGFSSFGSGSASVRFDDGICLRHDRYLSARASCADFTDAASPGVARESAG